MLWQSMNGLPSLNCDEFDPNVDCFADGTSNAVDAVIRLFQVFLVKVCRTMAGQCLDLATASHACATTAEY
jgi:hypothetical protein